MYGKIFASRGKETNLNDGNNEKKVKRDKATGEGLS